MKSVNNRWHALDGLRGWAAISVAIFHGMLFFTAVMPEDKGVNKILLTSITDTDWSLMLIKIITTIFNGSTAVGIFFILSGAVLIKSISKCETTNNFNLAINFIIKRIFRIFPALVACLTIYYISALILSYFFPLTYPAFSFSVFIENVTLYAVDMHGPTWTLKVEMQATIFILITYILRKQFGPGVSLLVFLYSILALECRPLVFGMYQGHAVLLYFAAGIVAADFANNSLFREATNNGKWIVSFIGILFVRHLINPNTYTPLVVQCVFGMIIIAHLMSEDESYLKKALSNKTSVYLGKISYSFYLWCVPTLWLTGRAMLHLPDIQGNFILYGVILSVISIGLAIPISHFSEKFIEQRFIAIASRISFGKIKIQEGSRPA